MTGSYQAGRLLGAKRKSVLHYKGVSGRGRARSQGRGVEATHKLRLDSVNERRVVQIQQEETGTFFN